LKRIGLTGNIGSGKSLVAAMLQRTYGLPTLDADQVSRQIVRPGQPALEAIVARFGPAVLDPTGRLDRQALGRLVLGDAQARRDLESITHPLISAFIDDWFRSEERAGASLAVVEASLLVESGRADSYDLVLLVICSPQTQLQRLQSQRGIPAEQARAWLQTQMPAAEKRGFADVIIENDGSLQDLRSALDAAWPRIAACAR